MIAVCNSATFFAADTDSDIDLFVVTAPRRMWLVRTLLTVFFHLCGVRRHGNKVAGRFCLSFFCTTDALDFSRIALEGGDPYLQAWITRVVPVLDCEKTADAFWDANAAWATTHPESRAPNQTLGVRTPLPDHARKVIQSVPPIRRGGLARTAAQKILDTTDTLLEKLLLPRTLRHWKNLGHPWGVIITPSMLKFHDKDRRKEIREELEKMQ